MTRIGIRRQERTQRAATADLTARDRQSRHLCYSHPLASPVFNSSHHRPLMTGSTSMITISAFRNVPDIAKGLVRDLRVRWALEEARLTYKVRLLEQGDQDKPEYRALQPFGQVPIFEENGVVLKIGTCPKGCS